MESPAHQQSTRLRNGALRDAERRLPPVLADGFRPFFLLAGLYAVLIVPTWVAFLNGFGGWVIPVHPLAWHAHEMIYGFVLAAVAGFILTAVPSWTGERGFAGPRLLILVLVWLAGRIVFLLPVHPALIAAVDLSFIPALALAIVPSLLRSRNRRNFVFAGILALLLIANVQFHLDGASSTDALRLAVNTVLLMVALVGGRIVPAFTSAWLRQRGEEVRIAKYRLLDGGALVAIVSVLVIDMVSPGSDVAGMAAAVAAVLLALRLARWQGHRTLREPILVVLHVAYAWLPIALALKAAWLLWAAGSGAGWLHALTIGAFSTMILAVMSRASLGHTGRSMVAPPGVAIAYGLVGLAALARALGPTILPGAGSTWILAAAALWTAAFALFIIDYAPILCAPRADGRRG